MVQIEQQHTPPLSPSQVARRILRATGALMGIQVILRFFGIIEKIIMAHYFGTGQEANAFSAARRIVSPVMMLGEQVIMHSFLPSFVLRLREHGEKDAWRFASTTINLLLLIMAAVVVLGFVFTSNLLGLFLPGWVRDHAALLPLTITLTRVMLAAMIFLAVSSLTYCLLNSYKQFALPASADLALKGSVLLFAALFAGKWGAYALAMGFLVGAIAKLAIQSAGLGRRLAHYRPVVDTGHPGLKHFALLALPLIAGWGGSTFRGLMETRFVSLIPDPASVSALDYAKTICDIPVTFFPYVFGIALFPFLADFAVAGDRDRLRRMLMTATRMMVLIFVPLALAVIMLRFPIVLGLYGSAQFDEASARITVAPLQIYALVMLAAALEIIVNQFFFAMADTLRPTLVGLALVPVHIAICYYGVMHLEWGAVAIALALLVYRSGKVIVLYALMRRKLGSLGLRTALPLLARMAVALLPFLAILLLAAEFLPEPGQAAGKVRKLLALLPYVVAGGVAMLVYGAVLHWLRVEEIGLLVDKVRGKLRKTPGPPEAV